MKKEDSKMKTINLNQYSIFGLYLLVVILLNVFSINFFFRMDLTKDRIFTLSEASKDAVMQLEDPLTIKAFFSQNLAPPYNQVEQQVKDLLEEYALIAPDDINFSFYKMGGDEATDNETQTENEELASKYSIYPFELPSTGQETITLQKAYMGLSFVYGDIIETINGLTNTDKLEYRITSIIQKLNAKISTYLKLEEKIKVKLYYSEVLNHKFPYGRNYYDKLKEAVDELNPLYFNTFEFESIEPNLVPESEFEQDILKYNIEVLSDKKGTGDIYCASLVIEYKDNFTFYNLLQEIPLFGGYTLYDPEQIDLKGTIEGAAENIIGIKQELGFLSSHSTIPLYSYYGGQDQLSNFYSVVSGVYQIKQVDLKNEEIPPGLSTLILAGPKAEFNDYELLLLDQYLMKGGSLAIFLDSYQEYQQQQLFGMSGPPQYLPFDTNLEKLLNHYGLNVKNTIVLDLNCYSRMSQGRDGSYFEETLYQIPIISQNYINQELGIISRLKELIVYNTSPLEFYQEKLENKTLHILFSSSEDAWEVTGENFNPYYMVTPKTDESITTESFPLACVLEGNFTSYFKDAEIIPTKPAPEEEEPVEGMEDFDIEPEEEEPVEIIETLEGEKQILEESIKEGKIFLIGSSTIITNSLLGPDIAYPNTTLVLNVLDYLNDKEENALLRSKGQLVNPLNPDIEDSTKTFVRWFNVAGLPILIILLGFIIWWKRKSLSNQIQKQYMGEKE
jgi:ABC-2 type transport system permease protein